MCSPHWKEKCRQFLLHFKIKPPAKKFKQQQHNFLYLTAYLNDFHMLPSLWPSARSDSTPQRWVPPFPLIPGQIHHAIMKIWIEYPARQRMGDGLSPWMSGDGLSHANRDETRADTPFPPLMCRKMWMRKWELKMKRRSPPPPPLLQCISLLLLPLLPDWSPAPMWYHD